MFCNESDNWICINTIGSYKCVCMDGYQEFINEANHVYEGQLTIIKLSSRMKLTYLIHSQLLIDIDECQDFNHCSPLKYEECVNTQGSYSCQCMTGYKNSTSGMCIGKLKNKLHLTSYCDLTTCIF